MDDNDVGFKCYQTFLALKAHFTTDSYDFVKYNGKIKANREKFLKRKDRWTFASIQKAHQAHLIEYLVANFVNHGDTLNSVWVTDMSGDAANKVYVEWKRRQDRMSRHLQEQIVWMMDNEVMWLKYNKFLHVAPDKMLHGVISETISIDTMLFLAHITGKRYEEKWAESFEQDFFLQYLWNDKYNRLLKKYAPFSNLSPSHCYSVIKDMFVYDE